MTPCSSVVERLLVRSLRYLLNHQKVGGFCYRLEGTERVRILPAAAKAGLAYVGTMRLLWKPTEIRYQEYVGELIGERSSNLWPCTKFKGGKNEEI